MRGPWGDTPLWRNSPHAQPEPTMARSYVLFIAAVTGLFGFQLLLMAGTFVISLAGRFWMPVVALLLYFVMPTLIAVNTFRILEDYFIELATIAVVLKISLAVLAFWYGNRRGLISGAGIAGLVGIWLATLSAVYIAGYIGIYLPFLASTGKGAHQNDFPDELRNLAVGIALLCPLFRVALAPLALAWNRHR
jgi:hypothetical protein